MPLLKPLFSKLVVIKQINALRYLASNYSSFCFVGYNNLTINQQVRRRRTATMTSSSSASISKKPSVYITREINDEAFNLLSEHCTVSFWPGTDPIPHNELRKEIATKNALFCMLSDKIDSEILNAAGDQLKVIATMSVGYDHLDVGEIRKRHIKIGYTPDILTDATAELTVALLLATSRRLLEANNAAKTGAWSSWSPFWMCGPSLAGSTVGIVGFGRIGQAVAKRLKAFNIARLIYSSSSNSNKHQADNDPITTTRVAFDELLTESDFVVITCALTPDTFHLFDERAFTKMKKTAVLVNTSRGDVIDQGALVAALQTGRIWAAGLDVMAPEPLPVDSPLFALKNCVILPHIGSACIQTRNAMALMTAQNILAGLNGDQMPGELIV